MAFYTTQFIKGKERRVYAKIGYIHGDKHQQNYRIDFYEEQALSADENNRLGEFWQQFVPVLDGENDCNFIKQAYQHVKCMVSFDGAEDC